MAACPACQHELDDAARAAGRCPACGAPLRSIATRTIADIRPAQTPQAEAPKAPAPPAKEPEVGGQTIDLSAARTAGSIDIKILSTLPEAPQESAADAGASSSSSQTISDDDLPRLPLPQPGDKPGTITFGAERTIEFTSSQSAIDESMLTSQWEGNIPKGYGAGATIRQKETLTGSYVSSSSLIVKSRHVTRTGTPAARPVTPADAPDYELLNVIGEGGMGVVYAARQSSIARTVALKMLKAADADLSQRDKFISEAVVTGELDHPNIVPIYDLGANDDGALFYSMKRVKGTPWHKVIREKSLGENLNILLRVADAVAFAHVNGVIHRDLKPENVMLGDFGEVLVMDWGLARVTADFPNAASVTQSDAMGGTPAYMAPEMATGPLEKITAASDVYLLGAILYEIITGKPPHTGKTVMACLFAAAKNQIAPSDVTGELTDIALKAMSTKSEARHESVQDFQAAVREYQAHAESLRLLNIAGKHVEHAAARQDYELYARALYALEESLSLWPGNRKAEMLLAGARMEYARLALNRGDFDLGASLLDSTNADHQPLLAEFAAGRNERESRQRRIKLLKGAVGALAASVLVIFALAYVAVGRERDEAVRQRGIAEEERDRAEVAEDLAQLNFENEQKAHRAEEAQRRRAEENERFAREQEQLAKDARDDAVDAQRAEAYEAYVARIGLIKVKLDENAFDVAADLLDQCPPDLRNWEWGRLKYLTQMAERSWSTAAPLQVVAASPVGRHFATGDQEGRVILWNLETGEREHEFTQGRLIHSLAYDIPGERLAVGSNDGGIAIYRTSDGQRVGQPLKGHAGSVLSVRFSPDGRQLLSCGLDKTARIWDLATGSELQKPLEGHTWWVWSAEFSPDARRIVTAGQDGQVVVWERAAAPDGDSAAFVPYERKATFYEHVGAVFAVKFSPTTDEVASAGNDGRVLLWDPAKLPETDLDAIVREFEFRGGTVIAPPRKPPEYRALGSHRSPVHTLAFSPNGRSLASGGEDNVVCVWDAASGVQTHQLRGHASHVLSCAFTPDGQHLLSAGRDEQVKLWRPATYGETRSLASADDAGEGVMSARFSRDGSRVLTASRDRTASLWDVATLARRQHYQQGHQFLASAAAFYPDGTRVATAAVDGTVRVWDVAADSELFRLAGTGYAAAVAVSDDGRVIATPSDDADVLLWDAAIGSLVTRLAGHEATVAALRFAPGGQMLATGDENGVCRLWRRDAQTGAWQPAGERRGHSRRINALAFIEGGRRFVSASGDNTCAQWSVADSNELTSLVLKHPDAVVDMAVTPDGQFAVTACDDGQLRVWALADAQVLRTLTTPTEKVRFTSIDASADGGLLAAASAEAGTIRLWNLKSGAELSARPAGRPDAGDAEAVADSSDAVEPWLNLGSEANRVWGVRFAPGRDRLLTIGGNDAELRDVTTSRVLGRFSPHGIVASAALSPDGTKVATASWDRSVKVWDAATGRVVAHFPEVHTDYINAVCYSPAGDELLTASDDGTARLWNATTGEPLSIILRGHEGPVRQACYSPDGTRILTAGADRTARLWNAKTGAEVAKLTGHGREVLSVAYSANGQRIITGSADNRAIVWDSKTGERIQTLAGHTAGVTAVALSPDGLRALTGSQDTTAKLWDAATGKEIITLGSHAGAVTAAEFSPDGSTALTGGRDGRTLLWPAVQWTAPAPRQARRN